jgi:hypothetical protein
VPEDRGHSLGVELLHAFIGKVGNVHPTDPVAFQLGKDGIADGCSFRDRFMKLSLLNDQDATSACRSGFSRIAVVDLRFFSR